jgi:hypothetical protein
MAFGKPADETLPRHADMKYEPFPDPPIPDFDDEGMMVPPWIKFPNIPRRSIGWRMGVGEQYRDSFRAWFRSVPDDIYYRFREKYIEPPEWKGFL